MSPSYQFNCPSCNDLIELDLPEKVCLCPLCFAMKSICQCEECAIEECNNREKCLRKKEIRI
jgi:hypothetical protein